MNLFNYKTITAQLSKKTNSLFITLHPKNNAVNLEHLFELESLLNWCMQRLEIKSILIESSFENFSCGLDKNKLSQFNDKQIKRINTKTQDIVNLMLHLPQTIIANINKGASNIGCELSLGADIKIAHNDVKMNFNHQALGLTPGAGGMALLSQFIGQTHTRNWILSGKAINKDQLMQTGYIIDSYQTQQEKNFILDELLENISIQSAVPRIQTKMGLVFPFEKDIKKLNESDQRISSASLVTQDWKTPNEPMKAQSMKYATRLTLIQGEKQNHLNN